MGDCSFNNLQDRRKLIRLSGKFIESLVKKKDGGDMNFKTIVCDVLIVGAFQLYGAEATHLLGESKNIINFEQNILEKPALLLDQTSLEELSEIISSRKKKLIKLIEERYPGKKGTIFLIGEFEVEKIRFRQESSFYYLTGITEPGAIFTLDLNENGTLFVPYYGGPRAAFIAPVIEESDLKSKGINQLKFLGEKFFHFMLDSDFNSSTYCDLLASLKNCVDQGQALFAIYPTDFVPQKAQIDRLLGSNDVLKNSLLDISPFIADMRRTKNASEIQAIKKAINHTILGILASIASIKPGAYEFQVKAALESMFLRLNSQTCFNSVVAAGKNSTVNHYGGGSAELKQGDLLLLDVGAEHNYYCGDLSRTFPISGTFSDRQRQIYTLVLETQEHIAKLAAPGYCLSNRNQQEKSLTHLAFKFLGERGYAQFMNHGIGHYMGLDVHDVGDASSPLRAGDVITIEPGIYLPEENFGIRIEDNYLITEDGAICLSSHLPKSPDEIEHLMKIYHS